MQAERQMEESNSWTVAESQKRDDSIFKARWNQIHGQLQKRDDSFLKFRCFVAEAFQRSAMQPEREILCTVSLTHELWFVSISTDMEEYHIKYARFRPILACGTKGITTTCTF